VFSPDRQELVNVLLGQIAISLENATLYADLKGTLARQVQLIGEGAARQAELSQTNDELLKQKTQLSEQTAELQIRNAEINVVSLQRKKAEEETRQLNSELEQRIQDRTADLSRSNQELEQFAYVASHDLQEPLRKISSYAQLLDTQYRGKLDADADEFIGYMVDGAQRMRSLIQNLLAYSRIGRKSQPFAPVDTNSCLVQALGNLDVAIQESGAVVTSTALPTVLGDVGLLVQLFQNLIANAVKFRGTAKPLIYVEARTTDAEWTISIKDNGIGIDLKFAERIFVIFQRLHSREEYAGTGIGLAFCKKIVERHGGRIWIESTCGEGTTFFFSFPRSADTDKLACDVAPEV
jgi:light-regulated signal transduction histidine kinase (bacteriophytochrome)